MDNYQSIGHTKKTYGVKGELKLKIADKHLEDLAHSDVLFLDMDGRKIPCFVEYVNFENPFTIKFEDYDNKESAQDLTGKEIFLRASDLLSPEERTIEVEGLYYEKYLGYIIEDQELGPVGTIDEIIEYPQQEMALILKNEAEILIPMNEQLITEIKEKDKVIIMNLPTGLIDLSTP
jgi:16S rRNA processing protein RimM